MPAKYLNIKETDFLKLKRVQKFLPLERALQLLETKKLWFSNPAKWPDPFERRFVDGIYPGNKKFTWQGRVYCLCVTTIPTSEASWKAYSDKDIAVKLEFDRVELQAFVVETIMEDEELAKKVLTKEINKIKTATLKARKIAARAEKMARRMGYAVEVYR